VPLNCSAIPEGIFESELFGSVKGAFHEAVNKPGKLEMAHDGTMFLDEIGDMSLTLQPKLLRFLEDKLVTRLGETKTKKVNVRVVAATNQNLDALMAEKMFRADLYQRLACVILKIPPLRERTEDIPPLTRFFIRSFASEHGLREPRLTEEAQHLLVSHDWPGNVRELRNVLVSCMVRSRGELITAGHLWAESKEMPQQPVAAAREPGFASLQEIEKKHIEEALRQAGGNKLQAAKLLGISRDTLYKKIEKYGL
jgi:transcriptional regulator with PAS, ATPase and Fis domain